MPRFPRLYATPGGQIVWRPDAAATLADDLPDCAEALAREWEGRADG